MKTRIEEEKERGGKDEEKNNTREWRGMKSIDNPWGIHGRRLPLLGV